MHIKANAKINPVLNIAGVLDNGYHRIDTLMQSVSLADDIYIEKIRKGIIVECKNIASEKSISFKAAELFFKEINKEPCVSIRIIHRIPFEAGLGGASANAAAVLNGLNEMYGYPIKRDRLIEISAGIGADVPFCVVGGTARCEGIGEKLTDFPFENKWNVVILKSANKPSTAAMYGALDKTEYSHPDTENFCKAYLDGDFAAMKEFGGNSFSCLWNFEEIYDKFYSLGADYCGLSGSGPCVFGIFKNKTGAENCAKNLTSRGEVFICETVN